MKKLKLLSATIKQLFDLLSIVIVILSNRKQNM